MNQKKSAVPEIVVLDHRQMALRFHYNSPEDKLRHSKKCLRSEENDFIHYHFLIICISSGAMTLLNLSPAIKQKTNLSKLSIYFGVSGPGLVPERPFECRINSGCLPLDTHRLIWH